MLCLISGVVGWAAEGAQSWEYSAAILGYLVPHDRDFALPTVTADRGKLHLEGRYNYEDLDTGSLWAGYNVGLGEEVRFTFTAMAGGVFGEINGIAPGYRAAVGWKKLELFTEGEYFLDAEDQSGDFFYTWSELSVYPKEWFRLGGVAQKTRAYETERDIQRGFLAGASYKRLEFTVYVFNPDQDPTIVLGLSTEF